MEVAKAPEVFYFGKCGDGGHRLVNAQGDDVRREVVTPWGKHPDGTLLEGLVFRKVEKDEGMQPEGRALLHHKDGWTALSFWDRSGDTRFNSNSNFFAQGEYTFDEMLALAKEQFHGIFARMKFQVTEINP